MKRHAFLLIFTMLLVPAQLEFGHSQQVILLVLDGADPSYFSLEGFSVEGQCQAVFPTMTKPGHVSLLTGVYPQRHGILANEYNDRKKTRVYTTDMIEVPTLFDMLRDQGKKSVFISGKEGLAAFLGPEADICISPQSHPSYIDAPPEDAIALTEWIFTSIMQALTHEQPDFMCINVPILDDWGHDHGPRSEEVSQATAHVQEQIAHLRSALHAHSTLIVTADHGMSAVSQAIPVHALLRNAGYETWPLHVGRCAFLYELEPDVTSFVADMEGIASIITPDQYSTYGVDHHRAPDLILLAEEGYLFIPQPLLAYYKGMHGSLQETDVPLYMTGAGIPSGSVSCNHVDIAPLVCSLLSVESTVAFDGTVPQVKEKEARGYGIAAVLGIILIILFKKFLQW
jgi:alkaline phosphatase D